MFELEKRFSFDAGHVLPFHHGKCSTPHGHTYGLRVIIRSPTLQSEGPEKNMVMDFSHISSIVKPMINEYLDHKWLNDSLKNDSPTAEFIAKWIYDYLEPQIPGLHAIVIHETESASATYSRSKL
jgi:6-pyruvoyltetrahydropterin/6-carboxytetrahydropterin synthase